ncbi:MAG: bacillithiol system redox-active protein YtxJ [Bacteroidota bacterium]|jgi:bacillithiol system protein YtxJ
MISWIPLVAETDLDTIVERSHQTPCVLFKHSTTCSISAMAKARLERNWSFSTEEVAAYYLDLLAFRPISAKIAARFNVHHESPQLLLVVNGACTYDASHLDITVDELRSELPLSTK